MKRSSLLQTGALAVATSRALRALWEPFTNGAATILMLHRFADPEIGVAGHDSAILASQLEELRRRRYNLISLRTLVRDFEAGRTPPRRTVVFTVDDGYADFARVGGPLFARYDVPATLFVVTGFIDQEIWMWPDRITESIGETTVGRREFTLDGEVTTISWSTAAERQMLVAQTIEQLKRVPTRRRLEALRSLTDAGPSLPDRPPPRFSAMSWDDIRALSRKGIEFGAHSHTHPILSRSEPAEAEREIFRSWARLREALPSAAPLLCYPNGMAEDFGERERRAAAAAGFVAAVAAYGGHCTPMHFERDRFALPRFSYEDEPERFWKVVGGLERLRDRIRGAT